VRLQACHSRFDGPARLVSQQLMNLAVGAAARLRRCWLAAKEELAAVELGDRPATSSVVQLLYHQHQRSTAPSPAPAKTGASVVQAFWPATRLASKSPIATAIESLSTPFAVKASASTLFLAAVPGARRATAFIVFAVSSGIPCSPRAVS